MRYLLVLVFLGNLAQGQNNAFLPGDAFFSTSLTGEKLAGLEDGKSDVLSFGYQRLDNSFTPSGHLGYNSLKITEVDAKFRENFIRAYRKVRGHEEAVFVKTERDAKVKLVEWNPVVSLIYNKGKVASPLGVKFNEDWKVQGRGVYSGFLDDGFSVLQDWQRGEEVSPLKLLEDLSPDAHLRSNKGGVVLRIMDQELALKAADCEIVFVGLLKKNSWVHNECLNLKQLARLSNWRDSRNLPRYVSQINVTSESACYSEFGDDGWEKFLLGEYGQLLPLLEVPPATVEGDSDSDHGD